MTTQKESHLQEEYRKTVTNDLKNNCTSSKNTYKIYIKEQYKSTRFIEEIPGVDK